MRSLVRQSWVLVVALASLQLAWGQGFKQSCDSPAFPSSTTTPIDSSCGQEGKGGREANQNAAKNNFCAGGESQPITFDTLNGLQTKVEDTASINFGDKGNAPRKSGPTTDRSELQSIGEGNPVVLKGFVLIARQEGGESVNCGNDVANTKLDHDIHISIVETADQRDECKSIVVEMSPHHRPADWTAENVKKLAPGKHMVRVTGQQMFDSSHVPCANDAKVRSNPMRSSLWEIHPIYKFEVCTAECDGEGKWQDLTNWLASQ